MRAILTIAEKDLKSLLQSPLFYTLAGLCTVLWSYSYMRNLLTFAEQTRMAMQQGMDPSLNMQREVFTAHISLVNLLFVFFVPAFTMRLLSEEKRMRTYDLLLTSPITATQIALGKFLAGLGAVSLLILISFLYPLCTRVVAEYPMAPLISAYVGVFLVAASYIAVGLFASALSESLVLSVAMGFFFNIMLWFIASGANNETHPMVASVLEYLSLGQHFLGFIVGLIKVKSLVFFASLIGLFVFLTQRVVESSRWR